MWRGRGRWSPRDWLTVIRDVVCLGLGMFGVINEELSGKADLGRLTFFALLMVAPGALAGLALLQQQSGTGGQSSAPQEPPQPSLPPSAPATGGGRE